MDALVAFCGIDCAICPALIATKKNDNEMRKKIAEDWTKQFNTTIRPEDINCDGCIVIEGRHIGYCAMCEIRKCGISKKVKNCAHCEEYVCVKLEGWFKNVPDAKKTLDEIKKSVKK